MAEFTFNKEIAEERRRKKTFTFDDRAIKESQERRQQAALKEYNKQNLITGNEAMDFFLSDKRDTIKAAGAEKAWQDMESYFAWQKEQDRLLNMDIDAETKRADHLQKAIDVYDKSIKNRSDYYKQSIESIQRDIAGSLNEEFIKGAQESLARYENELAGLDSLIPEYANQFGFNKDEVNEEFIDSLRTDVDKLRGDIAYAKFKQGGAKLENDALSAPDFDSKNAYGRDNLFGAESVEFFIGLFRDLNMNYAWEENEFFAAMTEKERKILGYYLAHGDSDAATEYVNYLRETVGNKVAEQHRKDADAWYEKLGYSVLAGIDQFRQGVQGLGGAITGDTSYTPASPLQQGSALIRQDIKDGEGVGNAVLEFGYDLINTTAHMLPSIAVGLANPTAGAILLGSSAGGNAYTEMINEGRTWGEAVAYGTLVGISETKLEKVLGATLGTSKLAKLLPKVNKAAKRVAITIGADMISEFTEESLQAVLEPWFKSIVTGLDYDAPDIEEVLYNGLLGAISGGMFSGSRVGGNTIADAALNRANDIQAGNALLKSENANGDIQSLVDAAQQSDNKKLKKAAEKVSKTFNDGQYDASARNVGRLARLSKEQLVKLKYDAASGANIKSQTIAKLTESGLQTKEAERAFDTIVRDATKGEISQELQKLMQKNSAVRPVYDQMTEYMTEEAAAKRAQEVEASSPVTEISNRIVYQRLKDAGIDVVEDAFVADDPVAVESIDDKGNLIIKTKSGNTVTYEPSEGMSNVSSKAGRKVAYASLYGINGANAYIKLAPDGINTEFFDTFNEIYDQGITDKEFSPTNSSVSAEVQQSIYNAGKADLENAAAKSRKAVEEAKQKEAAFVKKQMGFKSDRVTISDAAVEKIKSALEKGLSEQYKAAVKVIDCIAKMLQVNINIVASETDADGKYIGANGQYNRATNTFTFDITAGMDNVAEISYTAMVKTAGHELTHFIQNWSPSKYLTLKNTTLKFLTEEHSERWIEQQLKQIKADNKAIGKNLTLEQAKDELVADAFEDVLSNIDFAEAILRADKTLFDKVHSWVRSHVKKFKKSLDIAVKNVESQTLAADTMREAGKRAQKLYDLWADSLTTALENSTSFNMDQAIEQNKDLVAFHNITAEQLRDAVERDNLLMPSIAISNRAISEFGEISIVFDKSTIDPKLADNKLFGADAWTPTRSKLKKNAKFDRSATEAFVKRAQYAIGSRFDYTAQQLEDAIFNADGSIYNAFASDPDMQAIYAAENGIAESEIEATLDSDNGWRQYKKWLNGISDELITSYDSASNEEIISDMKSQPATAKPFKLSENGELVVPVAEYSSIEDLRKNKNRLSENADEQLKTVGEELLSWAKDISLNSEATLRKTVSVINNTFDSRYSVPDIVRSFKSNGIDISQQTASELQSLYKKAVELPTRYFEAKPQRAVSLSEIKAIIMPEKGNMSDLESYFNDMGIEIVKYTTEQSRIDALNSLDNVKFQSRRVTKEQDTALENSTSGQTDVDSDVQNKARPSKRDPRYLDPRTITENDVRTMLENASFGEYNNDTYIPLRRNTPRFFIDVVSEHSKGTYIVKDFPIAATAKHIRQNIEMEDGQSYGEERPHELEIDDIITISEKMSDPAYIVLQSNGRYVEVVTFYNKRKKQVIVAIDIANDHTPPYKNFKHTPYMNGYDEGYYNIVVSQYEPDNFQSYLANNEVVYDKKEMNGKYQVGSGRIVTVTHDNPFIKDTIPQESSSVKSENKQYSARRIQKVSDTETEQLEKHFGTTQNFNVAGYLLPDGKMLDFSGKHWGDTTSRFRQVDHRDVQEVLDRGNNGIDDMVDMIGSGCIRLMPETGGINLAVYPNEKQRQVLSAYINYMLRTEGSVIIDYDDVGADTVYSKEYGKTATSRQILADIRNYFNGGRQSDLMAFHTMGDVDFSARSVGMDFDTVTRREVADALDSFAEKLPDVRKAKLKGALISYRSHLENYERSRNTYEYALRNGNEELQNNALLSMKLNETVIRETENETIFRMNWGELESSLEGFVEKKREQYKRGRDEYMSRARATLAELRKNISSAERKAREMAQKRQTAEFRMRQIELRTQRDRYTSLLNKEKTKIKKAIESPSETASIPKGAEPIAKKLITVIDSMQKVIGTRGYTRSSQELLKMMLDVANVDESDDNAKYVLQRTYSQDKILLGTKLAMDQFISDLSLLSQDFKKLDPEYAPKEGEPYRVPSAASALIYDPDIDSSLSDFIAEYQGFYPGSPFAMENIYDCIKIVRAIGHQITSANKAYIGGKMVDILKLRDDLHRDMLVSSEFVVKLLGSNAISQFLTPKTMMHVFFGATESADTFYNLYDEGQTRYIRFVNGARDIFKPLEKAIEGNKFNRDKLTLKTDLKYVDGTPVVFNEDLALSFIKICENEDSLRHAVWGGLRVPDIHPYNKGKIKQAYDGNRLIENISTEINKAQKLFGTEPTDEYIESVLEDAAKEGKEISDKQYFNLYSKSIEFERQMYREAELMELYKKTAEKLKKQLSKEGIEMLGLLRKYYDGYAREKLDEATMEMYGFTKTLIGSKSYYPIRVSDNQKNNADNDLVKRDYSLENWGSMKNRKKSKAGIDLFGAVTELSSFVENTARYYAWTRTLKTSKSILKTQIIRNNGTVTTLAGAAAEKYGSYDSNAKGIKKLKNLFTADLDKYMKNLDAEINGATENKTPESIARLHGAFVTSALVANISPGFKQASALPLVSVDAGYKSFLKAYSKSLAPFANGKVKAPLMLTKAQMNYIARYSEVYRFRSSGMLDIDFAAMKNNKNAIAKFLTSKGMSWAELADAQVLGHQFYAILDNVKKSNPGLSAQDAAIKAGKQLDKTIQEFQANYTVLQRAPLLRSGNVWKFIFGTFRSQQITLLNAQVDSLVRTHSLSEQAKRAEGAEKKRLQRERTESRKRSGKIAVATAFSNALNGLLGALVTLIRRKEKDGEEIAEDVFFDFLDSYFTMIPGYGDLASFLVDLYTDRAFFGDGFASVGFLDTIIDFAEAVADILEAPFTGEAEITDIIKDFANVLAVFGIPARNAYNIIKMLIEWVEGVSNLFGVDWEVDTEEW